jgi:DNA primase
LTQLSSPTLFNIQTVPHLLRQRKDPWQAFWTTRQTLTAKMLESG